MKAKYIIRNASLSLLATLFCIHLTAQDSAARDLNISMRYFTYNNKISYILVNTKTKVHANFQPVKDIRLSIYLDSIAAAGLLGKVNTDITGNSYVLIPTSVKQLWDAVPTHKFLAVSMPNKDFGETTGDLEITKAKIVIDTIIVDSVKTISAKILENINNDWLPVKDVEIKIGIRRLGGVLPVGKEATYTTDSTGSVTAEFKRDGLPAENGILTLVVNVEDNDKYGNLVLEEKLPWGTNIERGSDWNKRTLWSTRFKTPIWLLSMAYSIMAAVWGVLIYLVVQILKIRKLGRKITPAVYSS